jgi:hypothetical protein
MLSAASSSPNTTNWIRIGLVALPVYGLLTIWATLNPQPTSDMEAWARFVTTNEYTVSHLMGSIFGVMLAIFGSIALGAYLVTSRSGRLGLVAMVLTIAGSALLLPLFGESTFGAPAIGRAYLAGNTDVMEIQLDGVMSVTRLLAIALTFVGNVLFGIAIWRSGTLPKWAGVIWIASAVVFYMLGVVYGIAFTGNSPPTQPMGAALIVISGGWIAWSALRKPSPAALQQHGQEV